VATVASVPFAPVTAVVKTDCQLTADAVGYAVPCPTVLPEGMMPTPPEEGCRFAVVAPSDSSLCRAPRARGWLFGSSQVTGAGGGRPGSQHLIVFGAPRVVRSPARAVDGPLVYPERVLARGRVNVGARVMRWFDIPMGNPSAFRGHLVLLWNASGHTFVYGFHIVAGMAMARALDLELVTHLRMVSPAKRR
jgi:hypothetical protein